MADNDFLEEVLVPAALQVKADLMESPDPDVKGKASSDVLDRSRKYGKSMSSGGNINFVIDKEMFGGMLSKLGNMMGVTEEVPVVRNVTPKPEETKSVKAIKAPLEEPADREDQKSGCRSEKER